MKRLDPSLKVKIVALPIQKNIFRNYAHEVCPGLTAEEAVCMKPLLYYSNMTYILPPIAFYKLMAGFKPDIIHIEEDPHSLIALETICLASLCSRNARITFFLWDNLDRSPAFPLNLIKHWLMRFSLNRTTYVVAGNQEAKQLLGSRKDYHGSSSVLPQFGIDVASYFGDPKPEVLQHLSQQPEIPLIGFMARLVSEKGILLLCEALDGLRSLPWKLIVVGTGPLEKDLQQRWKSKFGERLLILGASERALLPEYLKCLDILVAPSVSTSQWKEQFGYVLIEAMSAGVPVIGSSAGAIPEVIGQAGLIFPEGDVSRLREALSGLLQSSEERDRLSRLGRARAEALFTNEGVSASYLKIFEQVAHV
jgi:glycosyltransferase involved in cell wall biosynthesis